MLSGKRVSKSRNNILVIILAIIFASYHLGQYVFGTAEWLNINKQPSAVTEQKTSAVAGVNAAQIVYGVQVAPDQLPSRVVMQTVGIDLPLFGSIETHGNWDISEIGANFALNTAVPSEFIGNTVIFGHDRPGLFRPIHQLKMGDEISVRTTRGVYVYNVSGFEVVEPTDIRVMNQTSTSQLTLITCEGWTSDKRFIVHASFSRFISNTTYPDFKVTE